MAATYRANLTIFELHVAAVHHIHWDLRTYDIHTYLPTYLPTYSRQPDLILATA
jgi:hypothetical protein